VHKHNPPTFLYWWKKEKKEKYKKSPSIRFIIPYNTHTFTSCHSSYSAQSLKIISKKESLKKRKFVKKSAMTIFFCVSLTHVRLSHGVCRNLKRKIQVLLLYIYPLQANGHWFLYYIKVLYEAMVIDFFVTLRPSTKQLSLVIDFFTSRPSAR